ncbi:hypothetical protein [Nocardioides dilutus]
MSVRTRSLLVVVSVFVLYVSVTWLVAGARAQLEVGPSCATGGPYEIVAPCPEHSTSLILVGLSLSVVTALGGTIAAISVTAPNLVVLHWTILLAGLGGLFVVWGVRVDDGVSWNGVLTGLVFLVMALPGFYVMSRWQRLYRRREVEGMPLSRGAWWLVYLALAPAGVLVGAWTAEAWL